MVDYYSRFIEISKLTSTTTTDIVKHLKSIFARHGIPETVSSDNGPQYASTEFRHFAEHYGFRHQTSSPRYPQANGAAERAVKTVKALLNKNDDPYLAMLSYRATPLENGYSPAQLSMGRHLRTTVPVITSQLIPHLPKRTELRGKEERIRNRQKRNFDTRHRAKNLKPLQSGENVWIPDNNSHGIVVEMRNPRSYVVSTSEGGMLRRNRRHLVPVPLQDNSSSESPPCPTVAHQEEPSSPSTDSENVRTRCGRVSKPPDRLM